MAELALDDDQRDAFVRHLDCVSMSQLLGRAGPRISEALALQESDLDKSRGALLVRRGNGGKRREVGRDRWAWEQLDPWLEIRRQLPIGALLCVIHGPTAGRRWEASAARKQLHHAAGAARVRRRFAPHQDDQRAQTVAVGSVADRAHDRDDLLDRRCVCRVLLALVARWAASVVGGHRRGRTAVAGGVQQHGFHESSLGGVDDAAIRITPPGTQGALAATQRRPWCPRVAGAGADHW
jgi:hypothetical protein